MNQWLQIPMTKVDPEHFLKTIKDKAVIEVLAQHVSYLSYKRSSNTQNNLWFEMTQSSLIIYSHLLILVQMIHMSHVIPVYKLFNNDQFVTISYYCNDSFRE